MDSFYVKELKKTLFFFAFSDADICEEDDICLEYMRINSTRPSYLEIIPVAATISENKNTVTYNRSTYIGGCSDSGFDFTPYTNTDSSANASYAPWRYVINRHIGR